ncbi:hypothetical protein HHK36_002439 [Tetracentron sinense]|uniref:Uncharacterized protein n=1 Tax=Tetracentron sinense TaxID=13715 RepID=A0A834ZQA8_TETSI|nr:hypothetical protein HHK36_002439 [Tetracentron sinense]
MAASHLCIGLKHIADPQIYNQLAQSALELRRSLPYLLMMKFSLTKCMTLSGASVVGRILRIERLVETILDEVRYYDLIIDFVKMIGFSILLLYEAKEIGFSIDADSAWGQMDIVGVGESDRAKRLREDSLLLLRGFDSIASSLSQLTLNLDTALQSIHKKKDVLRKIFTCDEWNKSKWPSDVKGKKAMETVLSTTFWNNIIYAMKITAPLVRVLRLVDEEKKPPMRYIYEAMDRAKEAIKEAMGGQRYERRYKPIWNIIDRRWDVQLHQPLHADGYILKSEFYYNNQDIEPCEERLLEQMNSAPDILGPALIGKGEVQVEAREEWLKKNHHLHQMKQMTKNYTLMQIMMTQMGVTMT